MSNTQTARGTYIDHHLDVATAQVVENRRLVQVRQIRHVLVHEELGRVHLLDIVLLHFPRLSITSKESTNDVTSTINYSF